AGQRLRLGHLYVDCDAGDGRLTKSGGRQVSVQAMGVCQTVWRFERLPRRTHPTVLARQGDGEMEVGILLRRAPDDKGKPTALPEHPMKAHKRYGPTRKELHSIATDYRIPTALREREARAIHHLDVDVSEARSAHLADGLFHHLRRGVDGKH